MQANHVLQRARHEEILLGQAEAAARLGVFLHAAAADRLARCHGPCGFLAGEVMDRLPETFADLIEGRDAFPLPLAEVGI